MRSCVCLLQKYIGEGEFFKAFVNISFSITDNFPGCADVGETDTSNSMCSDNNFRFCARFFWGWDGVRCCFCCYCCCWGIRRMLEVGNIRGMTRVSLSVCVSVKKDKTGDESR